MAWKDIIKVDVMADSQKAIDVLGVQIENLQMIDDLIRKFANNEELNLIEIKKLAESHYRYAEAIRNVSRCTVKNFRKNIRSSKRTRNRFIQDRSINGY